MAFSIQNLDSMKNMIILGRATAHPVPHPSPYT